MCGIWFYIQRDNITLDLQNILTEKFENIRNRGPDSSILLPINNFAFIGFHRLSINDLSINGNQPFIRTSHHKIIYLVCNGEIYNSNQLISEHNLYVESSSDCESIIELYMKYGIQKTLTLLKGVFAGTIIEHDTITDTIYVIAFRDRIGVRPLYYSTTNDSLSLCSEIKGLYTTSNSIVNPFPPSHYMITTIKIREKNIYQPPVSCNFRSYWNLNMIEQNYNYSTNDLLYSDIRNRLENSVKMRLLSDRPICCLLSGGLDSSLVSALVAKNSQHQVHTFCIGFEGGTDFEYAKMVANHINSIHTEIKISKETALESLNAVIDVCETYDITTIRASVWQYLLCKYISENTKFKVVMMGDGSDELFGGYIYFNKSPNSLESHNECVKLLSEIHHFDVLRSDRAVACSGLETRVPFLDSDFIEFYLSIDQSLRFQYDDSGNNKIEKYLLRKSFENTNILPNEVLWRKKEAFSDGTSSNDDSWFTMIQKYISEKYNIDEKSYYKNRIFEKYNNTCDNNFIHYWLPNKHWVGDIQDPSARVLQHYSE